MKIILAGHGRIAVEMKNTINMIVGDLANLYAIDFVSGEGLEDLVNKFQKIIISHDEKILIVADLYGGSPYNAAAFLAMTNQNIEILSGMSLPMCLELLEIADECSIEDIFQKIQATQINFIKSFKFLNKQMLENEEEL